MWSKIDKARPPCFDICPQDDAAVGREREREREGEREGGREGGIDKARPP
jgi:hypothetical protein